MVRKSGLTVLLSLLTTLAWGCGSPPTGPGEATAIRVSETTPEPSTRPTAAPATPSSTSPPATPRPEATNSSVPTPSQELWGSGLPEECPASSTTKVELSSEGPGRGVAEIFEGQIRDFLNARGSATGLEEMLSELTLLDGTWQARAQAQSADVTGNTTPEVVVELTFFEPGQYAEGALFVYRCAGGEFAGGAVLTTAGQVLSADDPDGIRAVQDMNKDGIPEIVHSYISIAGSHAYFTRQFRILEWNGQEFGDLIPEDEDGFTALADSGDGVIRDRDGDGTLELILSNGLGEAYPDLGPQRARTDFWEWNGEAFVLARWEYTKPVFRIHAIWDGDDATRFGEYDRALTFYQDAVFNEQLLGWSMGRLWPDSAYSGSPTPTPDPLERPRLNAYGRYRIMLVHLVQGRHAEAQVVYDGLQARYHGGSEAAVYAVLAYDFWEEYAASGDLALACGRVTEFAKTYRSSVLGPLGREFYGSGQRECQPEDVCPFVQE